MLDLIPQSEELLEQLCQAGTRIIVLSGRERDRAALSRSVDDFLVKPCPSRKLLASIASVCLLLLLVFFGGVGATSQIFQVRTQSEVVAVLTPRAPCM